MNVRVPSGVLVARVRFYYPDLWRDARYPTRDRIIPFPLFWLYAASLGATLAHQRVQHTRATAGAIAMALAKKGAELPESLTADMRDAFLLPRE